MWGGARTASRGAWRCGGVLALLFLFVGLLTSARAVGATFETAGHFGGILPPTAAPTNASEFPEEVQLGGISGMAVNLSGAGGVPVGTVYVASKGGPAEEGAVRIAMFEPSGTSLDFRLRWEVTIPEGPYERCGPAVGTKCPARVETLPRAVDVDVDQVSGNVYVLSTESVPAGGPAVTVFKADGSEVITRFGEMAPSGATTVSTPAKIHESPSPGGIAVDGRTVYLFDLNSIDKFFHRLMVFKETTPGDPKTYAYVEGADIGAGFQGEGRFPARPVTDAGGDIYVSGESFVEKYTPGQPKPPVCKFEFAEGGITAMTVNRSTGEPFFYTSKDKKVHRLGACSGGKFSEVPPVVAVAPERDELFALAFDPARQLEETRAPGVLYGGAPGSVPSIGGKGEPGMGSLGYIFAPVAEADPVIETQAVSSVGLTSAELEAEINPRGSLTTYTFQYITETAYIEDGEQFGEGTVEMPSPAVVLGAGQKPLHAAAVAVGLESGTTYRYRVIAESHCSSSEPGKVCNDIGAAESLHTYALEVAGPPDNRAYELVSPAEKNGGQVLPAEPFVSSCGLVECKPGAGYNHFPMQSAPDGNAVAYEGTPFSASGARIENEYIARRTLTGWVNTNLTPPLLESKGGQGYHAFDANLTDGILEQIEPALSPQAPAGFDNLYLQSTTNPLVLSPLLLAEPPNRSPGTGEDRLRITYAAHSADFSHQIFEANDALTTDALAPADSEKENNLYEWVAGQLRLVNIEPDESTEPGAQLGSGTLLKSGNPNIPTAVVDQAISADGRRIFWTSKAGQLFVREDGVSTVEIEDPGKFLVASADGSRVLLSDGCLYVLASKACTDLTQGKAGFLGLAGRSDDLSHIYFTDTAVLTEEEENSEGDKALAGKPNLYAWVEGTTRFIATMLGADSDDWQASPAVRSAEAAPAGRYLAFTSTAQLTGVASAGFPEVFLYDSETATLSCPSCNPSGSVPLGESLLRLIKGAQGFLAQPRYLTDSGRLYFDTRDSLTYLDTNADVEDVYQYEPQGLGSCDREGGCVSLVSAGRGAVDSNFLAMDPSGNNVFFTTRDQLVAADKDELIDLYDARVGGGIPEPPPPVVCGGEACQPPTPVPAEPSPTSQPPLGGGNYKPPKCKKGQVRRNGKCVKKPKQKSKQGGKGKGKAKKQGGSK